MGKVLDSGLEVNQLELQSCYYVHFRREIYKSPYVPAIGLIVPLLFFSKDGFAIKWPTTVDMPLNKEIQPNKPSTPIDKRVYFLFLLLNLLYDNILLRGDGIYHSKIHFYVVLAMSFSEDKRLFIVWTYFV